MQHFHPFPPIPSVTATEVKGHRSLQRRDHNNDLLGLYHIVTAFIFELHTAFMGRADLLA